MFILGSEISKGYRKKPKIQQQSRRLLKFVLWLKFIKATQRVTVTNFSELKTVESIKATQQVIATSLCELIMVGYIREIQQVTATNSSE